MADELEKPRQWSRAEKLKARTLYLIRGLSPKEIGEKLDRTPSAVSQLANREGWSAKRKEAADKADAEADARAVQTIQTRAVEFAESIADQGEDLVERGFDLARKASDSGEAKDFAFAVGATGKAIGFTRQALGMDAQNSLSIGSVNVFFAQPKAESIQKADTESETVDI